MKENKSLKTVAMSLILLPLAVIALRIDRNGGFTQLGIEHRYVVNYEFQFQADEPYRITTFLPKNDHRQQIHFHDADAAATSSIFLNGSNKLIQWSGLADSTTITLPFEFTGKPVSFAINPSLPHSPAQSSKLSQYLLPTELIQSEDPRVSELVEGLAAGKSTSLSIIQAFYDHVFAIPTTQSSELTDALMVLDNNEASCNGKSRLLTALCRNVGIPARIVGGLILEETTKRTSHSWVEIRVADTWIPFDALNGHFASLPSHYLELYNGDHFLITHTKGMDFDYRYSISKERTHDYPALAALNIWQLIDEAKIPYKMLKMILLLPFGAFLVAIFKNIVGLKTYGVFLPVLIALSLLETGLVPGLLLFTIIIAVVALVNLPLEMWSIQYNAKISTMLIAVVITALLSVKLLHTTGWLVASAPLFFPIIILTIVSERVARKIEEEGTWESVKLYGTTLIATLLIYLVLSSPTIQHFVMTFPEITLTVAGINLLLGKWIGLRLLEYYRFQKV